MTDARTYVDIAVIVPLHEEFVRLEAVFKTTEQSIFGTSIISRLDSSHSGISMIAILQGDMGKNAATIAAERLLSNFNPSLIVVLGIAGGLSGDTAVGDVCFTGTIADVLENAKISEKGGRQKVEFNTKFFNTDDHLRFSLSYSKLGMDVKAQFEEWSLINYYAAKNLIPGEFIGRDSKNEVIGIPNIHFGTIVCGQVGKSDIYKSDLKNIDRKVLALETESGGVFAVADSYGCPVVTIRGICDYADKNKNDLEQQTSGHLRKISADNAISFLKLQFSNPQFLKYIETRKSELGEGEMPLLEVKNQLSASEIQLATIKDTIHEKLSDLSPEYKGKPKGYRLPLPRLKPAAAKATITTPAATLDIENILDAIAKSQLISIGVPRSYPDNTLPWLLAAEVSRIELDGKQAVPFVVKGDDIHPPSNGFADAAGARFSAVHDDTQSRPVLIILEFPLSSRTRIEMLKRQLELYPATKVVIVNRDDASVMGQSDLVILTGAEHFNVCDVSFVEMCTFLQRSFELDNQEASVLAFKLQEMFKRFRLNAHPSYFASVGTDLLSALLKSNRRAELLNLAVAGYLSFVVLADKTKSALSRTAREDFLRRIVLMMKSEKRTFNYAEAVSEVEKFSDESDYGLDPISFLQTFVDKGILHFSNSSLRFSLPFMESYLLAAELVRFPDIAFEYFRHIDENLDLETLDIYAELGPDEKVVKHIENSLVEAAEQFKENAGGGHILLTDEIRPALVDKRVRIAEIESRLEKAFDDVLTNRPNSLEKQKLLDVAARVQESAKVAHDASQQISSGPAEAKLKRLTEGFRAWVAATVLLGSGAERLKKEPKRSLAQKIAELTSVLIDEALRVFPKLEFDTLKSEMTKDENLRSILKLDISDEITSSQREFVSTLFDAYEFSLLGYPLRTALHHLGNAAGQPLLWNSVSSISSDNTMVNLVGNVWASEIDAHRNSTKLLESISHLPPTPFLRISLSTHFMLRVFWNHWDIRNRLALLDAADASLTPITGRKIDRARVERAITTKEGNEPAT